MGANVYLQTDLHEKLIKKGHDPGKYVNKVVKEALEKEEVSGTKRIKG
ncbi:MAG: hypothetical protein PHZ02_01455 [Desulfocapsaceae bacterium]|nr:hypothetical protein [Desulfocapsaceae bacterium]